MAEFFSRATLSPEAYDVDIWTPLHEIKTATVGAMVFDFSITNTSVDKDIAVEVKLVDRDGNLAHYILGPTILKANGISWDSSHKIVMMPGDRLMVKASDRGICFYTSLVTNLKTV